MKPEYFMYRSLLGLSVCDATGENVMHLAGAYGDNLKAGNVAGMRAPMEFLPWSDDTAMSIGVYRVLSKYKTVNQLALAKEFANNAHKDPQRGYGKGTARLLYAYLYDAENWEEQSKNWWGPNTGSKGNGSAMRDSIIGAYFGSGEGRGNNYARIVEEATLSAQVTHYHPEAIAGSIAVAIAAAVATYGPTVEYWDRILQYTPPGVVRDAIHVVAKDTSLTDNWKVVGAVGNGSKVTALDTVPFALWIANKTLHHFEWELDRACAEAIECGGDTDTVCAMVGGILGNTVPPTSEMIARTEPLPADVVVKWED